jgi:hypothetical protein
MTKIRKRRHRRVLLEIKVEHAICAAVICLFMAWVGWQSISLASESAARCADDYARARSAADTLAVDNRKVGGRGLPATCGGMRRDGTLGRIAREAEQ